jgi:hypothetical protein
MSVTARAFFYVQQVEQQVRRRLDECLQPDGITAGQYMVMNLIIHHEPNNSSPVPPTLQTAASSR